LTVVDAAQPDYELNLLQRIALGRRYRTVSDVERIGGWGRGFNLVVDAILIAIVSGYTIAAVIDYNPDVPTTHRLVGLLAWVLGIGLFVLVHRLNRCGAKIEDGKVVVVNPRGTVELPISEVVGLGKGKLGIVEALLLKGGRRITLWGIEWWTSLRPGLIEAGVKELEWRLEVEHGREQSSQRHPDEATSAV
jgi:hypothetical protein